MYDLVERLRRRFLLEGCAVCSKAADEIERLKNQISHIIEHNNPQIEQANSYFKLLEEDLFNCNKIIDAYEEEHSKLRAEIERLRAAIQRQASEPKRRWKRGDRVRKKSGAQWQGRIVGFYETALTPIGYAIESEYHKNTVQIFPEAALEDVPE